MQHLCNQKCIFNQYRDSCRDFDWLGNRLFYMIYDSINFGGKLQVAVRAPDHPILSNIDWGPAADRKTLWERNFCKARHFKCYFSKITWKIKSCLAGIVARLSPIGDDHTPHQTSKKFCFPTTADKYLIDSKLVRVLGLLPRCKVKQQLCVSSFSGNVPCKGINAYVFATTIKQQTFLIECSFRCRFW